MNAVLVVLSGSVGVGLLDVVALRLLRPCPVGFSLLAIIGITVCVLNTSTVTTVLIARSVEVPLTAHVTINLLAGAVSVLIGLLLVRVVLAGRGRRAVVVPDAPRVPGFASGRRCRGTGWSAGSPATRCTGSRIGWSP
ncbi:hypothetical protein SAMN05421805_106134 [Saccharopolyspora antimicrobica]|uniref:Uncharacterized protein n=1 Tax=Saccharopolyspora antimicrobica TaxID=455193 RepID=A0A1I5B6G6_9PSEU|nr:hypothetical protein [Saccharopolyspora antimicrobica]SFN70292.1 hypothetical protein SAMN05421805_106134 [Saccharopolyspora antimicrobica]